MVFDEVIVCILNNASKKSPLFSIEERVKMLGDVTAGYTNVTVASSEGLLVDFAKENGVNFDLLTFRVPVNAVYKFYLSKTKDIALAPYAGVHVRALVAGKEEDWKCFQVGWQTGLRFDINKVYLGISYARDFPDETKNPHVHECSVHLGYCF